MPGGVAVDGSGNVYVADKNNHVIRKVTNGGVVSTFAGLAGAVGAVDGAGILAQFNGPSGVAVDAAGNVFVADTNNHVIRKITSAGEVSTLAGMVGVSGSADGTGGAAQFNGPVGVAVDGYGNVYVADKENDVIRKITSGGVVSTLAGLAGVSGSADGNGSSAKFNRPSGVAVDGAGNVYVADKGNHLIRRIASGGDVTAVAGVAGVAGSLDGTASDVRFDAPGGVAVDLVGNVYVADELNSVIRKITSGGVVQTLAGTTGVAGSADGARLVASFNGPIGVAVDGSGNLYVADRNNNVIRRVTGGGVVNTVAGSAGYSGSANGPGDRASFYSPNGVALGGDGSVYVADTGNHVIRRILSGGTVSTLAGEVGATGWDDGVGGAARFNFPVAVAVDGSGTLYVADRSNHVIRRITSAGVVSTPYGLSGVSGSADGTGSEARFHTPSGVAVDRDGNIYVADRYNHAIRRISVGGVVSTLAGAPGTVGNADGTGVSAGFNSPLGVAVDGFGNVYVSDWANHTIRKITSGGVVSTLAGQAGVYGSRDGAGNVARFKYPDGLAVDGFGNVYVADVGNHLMRMITSSGEVRTIGGLAGVSGSTDGFGGESRFSAPYAVAVDGFRNLFVADLSNHKIRYGKFSLDPPEIYAPPQSCAVVEGGSASFSVSANGTAPFLYQWRFGGNEIPGANGATFVIPSAQFSDSGTYDVLVSNSAASATSAPAHLLVCTAVAITEGPVGGRFQTGASGSLSVSASGTSPYSYQWRRNGRPVLGGTSATLSLSRMTPIDAGVYDVVVSNPASHATSSAAEVLVDFSCIRGAPTNMVFDLPLGLSTGTATSAQLFSYPYVDQALPVTSGAAVSGGSVGVNLRNITASGNYFLRFAQVGANGESVSSDSLPFGVTVRNWADGAGNYEALLESATGEAPDGAAYRGLLVTTVSKTGSISGRVQYVEATPMLDEGGAETGRRAYAPVVRSFSGALVPKNGEPLVAVFSARLGAGAELGRQELEIQLDYASNPVRFSAWVKDSASSHPSIWTSRTEETLVSASGLDSVPSISGNLNLSDLAGLYNLAADSSAVGERSNGYVLAQVGRSGRVVWRSRFLGRGGSGSGMLKVENPALPAVVLCQWSASQPAGLFSSSVVAGVLNFERLSAGSWRMGAGRGGMAGKLELQGTYAKRVVSGAGTRIAYSEELGAGGWNGVQAVSFDPVEGGRWGSGASNAAPYQVLRDSNGQFFRSFSAISVLPGFFRGTGASRTMLLRLVDPESDEMGVKPEFGWNVLLSTSGQLKAEPLEGSGSPVLSLKLDLWYGEITGMYLRNGVRRLLYGVGVPLEDDSLQTGRGWVEKGGFPGGQSETWTLKGNP